MKPRALTLRNLPAQLDRVIRKRARERRISANKAVISLLEERLGLGGPQPALEAHDLDALAGTWSAEEADAFDATLAQQRTIDSDLWQ